MEKEATRRAIRSFSSNIRDIKIDQLTKSVESKMVFGSFLGRKEISQMMLKHKAAKLEISSKIMNIAEKYGYMYVRLFGYPFNYMDRIRARTVFSYMYERKGKVLDIGCSFGVLAFELARKGYSVAGVDVNPESIELANKINNILRLTNVRFINMDFLNNKFPANEFDIVIMVEVLEHIKDDCRAIQEIYRILREDGILIISVPYTNQVDEFSGSPCPSFLTKNGKRVLIGAPGEFHFRTGYNLQTLISLLKLNGFTVVDFHLHEKLKILPKSVILFPLSYIAGLFLSKLSRNYDKITVLTKKENIENNKYSHETSEGPS